jgi:hypothetical protein
MNLYTRVRDYLFPPKLRCKVGDVAQVVRCDSPLPYRSALNGVTVKVSALITNRLDEAAWKYEGALIVVRGCEIECLPDDWLMPITPPAGSIDESEVRKLFEPGPRIEKTDANADLIATERAGVEGARAVE